jgi:hypothetical protein
LIHQKGLTVYFFRFLYLKSFPQLKQWQVRLKDALGAGTNKITLKMVKKWMIDGALRRLPNRNMGSVYVYLLPNK